MVVGEVACFQQVKNYLPQFFDPQDGSGAIATKPILPTSLMMGRGAFIVIEGLDRSGKSTQAARLLERLRAASQLAQLLKFRPRTVRLTFSAPLADCKH